MKINFSKEKQISYYEWLLKFKLQLPKEYRILFVFYSSAYLSIFIFIFLPVVHNRKINYNSGFGNSKTTEFQLTCQIK